MQATRQQSTKRNTGKATESPHNSYQKLNTIHAGLPASHVIDCVLPEIKGGTQYAKIIHKYIQKSGSATGFTVQSRSRFMKDGGGEV